MTRGRCIYQLTQGIGNGQTSGKTRCGGRCIAVTCSDWTILRMTRDSQSGVRLCTPMIFQNCSMPERRNANLFATGFCVCACAVPASGTNRSTFVGLLSSANPASQEVCEDLSHVLSTSRSVKDVPHLAFRALHVPLLSLSGRGVRIAAWISRGPRCGPWIPGQGGGSRPFFRWRS